jgi:hypothetical protein
MERFVGQTVAKLNSISIKINAESHIARVKNALISAQRNLDLVIESILNTQKGLLQPQILSPRLLMETLRKSIPFFSQVYTGTVFLKQGFNECNK